MKTYYEISINVDGQVKCSSAQGSLPLAIEYATKDCIYYQAQYPDADVGYDLQERCACCHNEGEITIRKPRSVKRVRCPECKGKTPQNVLGVRFAMPNPANNIRLLAS